MSIRKIRLSGFSLVELLIAMALGLILVTGMIAVFSGNKRTSELTSEMANMQESARFVLETISNDIRSAGFQGCLGLDHGSMDDLTNEQVIGNRGMYLTAATGSIIMGPGNWQPQPVGGFVLPGSIVAVTGTHTISLQGGTENRVDLEEPMHDGTRPNPAIPLVLEKLAPFSANVGSPVIIADCENSNLFTITDMQLVNDSWVISHEASENTAGAFTQPFGNNNKLRQVSVTPYFNHIYFIGDAGVLTEKGDRITSLYQQSYPFDPVVNPPTELIQGIENMRVSFGIQDRNGQVQYVQANEPAYDPSAVVSVQIGLLMSSWDQIASVDDENTYVLAGQQIPASALSVDGNTHPLDARFRLAFNTTVKVRNRRVQKQ